MLLVFCVDVRTKRERGEWSSGGVVQEEKEEEELGSSGV